MQYRFFSRAGGVSSGVFSTFNLSYGVGDDPRNVQENRRRLKEFFAAPRLISAQQIHGDRIYCDDGSGTADVEVDGYDALISATPGAVLLIQQADCQGILLHHPQQRVIAAIHCGWRGSVANLIGKTIETMQQLFSLDPAGLEAFIGPSLGPCCAEFINHRRELPSSFREFQVAPNHFDFWQISEHQLVAAGVGAEHIRIERICTCCNPAYFSYRRARRSDSSMTGRHGSAMCLMDAP